MGGTNQEAVGMGQGAGARRVQEAGCRVQEAHRVQEAQGRVQCAECRGQGIICTTPCSWAK